ncbi:TIGR04222 domain-containing membrane protein [Streptomyces sp. LN785]|uniref:TIGR04222 domain-containing membrane protein n=1 Tax=Streptomyces sp. LN785 TaxID=3112983 RepID=UPI003723B7B4
MNTVALVVTLGVAVSSVLLIVGISNARRGPGGPVHDLYEVAFLNGGPGRVVDAAIAAMQADGRLTVGGPGIVSVRRLGRGRPGGTGGAPGARRRPQRRAAHLAGRGDAAPGRAGGR